MSQPMSQEELVKRIEELQADCTYSYPGKEIRCRELLFGPVLSALRSAPAMEESDQRIASNQESILENHLKANVLATNAIDKGDPAPAREILKAARGFHPEYGPPLSSPSTDAPALPSSEMREKVRELRDACDAAREFIADEYAQQNDNGDLIADPIPRKLHDRLCEAVCLAPAILNAAANEESLGAAWTLISGISEPIKKCFRERTMPFAEFQDIAVKWQESISGEAHPDTLRESLKEAVRLLGEYDDISHEHHEQFPECPCLSCQNHRLLSRPDIQKLAGNTQAK